MRAIDGIGAEAAGGGARVWTRVRLEGETRWLAHRWGGGALRGVRVEAEPPAVVLRPTAPDRFVDWGPRSGLAAAVRFELGESGEPVSLRVGEDGPRATRG